MCIVGHPSSGGRVTRVITFVHRSQTSALSFSMVPTGSLRAGTPPWYKALAGRPSRRPFGQNAAQPASSPSKRSGHRALESVRHRARQREPFASLGANLSLGARALGESALDALEVEAAALNEVRPGRRPARLRALARQLRSAQPAMAPFVNWSHRLTELAASARASRMPAALVRRIASERRQLRKERARLARTLAQALPRSATLLTMSRSATVYDGLVRLPRGRRPRRVEVLASLPGGEGRRLARDLRAAGIPARTVADRDSDKAARRAMLVMVGADAVEANGALIHKVGTRRLAESARKARVPFVAVFGSSKRLPTGLRVPRPPALFDRTPRALVSAYWTDRGVETGGRADRRAP